MGNQGSTRKPGKVTSRERLQWAHDRMMEAIRRAAACRADRFLTTAAFSRAEEYDALLAAVTTDSERVRREAISRARRQTELRRTIGQSPQPETT